MQSLMALVIFGLGLCPHWSEEEDIRMEGVESEDAAVAWKKKYDTLKEESETLKTLSARGSHSSPNVAKPPR